MGTEVLCSKYEEYIVGEKIPSNTLRNPSQKDRIVLEEKEGVSLNPFDWCCWKPMQKKYKVLGEISPKGKITDKFRLDEYYLHCKKCGTDIYKSSSDYGI